MLFFCANIIKLTFYLPLKNEIDNFSHPKIRIKPPSGVTNQMCFGLIPNADIKYNEPDKNKIPMKNNRLILFRNLSAKGGYILTNNNTIT